jgi:hypothetical protein
MDPVDDKYASDLIKKIFTPILLCFGLIGNIISIVIFSRNSLKKYTTFRYLTLLSLLDLCVLYTGIMKYFASIIFAIIKFVVKKGCGQILLDVYFQIDIRLINEFSCKMHSFLVYFFTHCSSMLLASMSIDRTIAITIKQAKKFSTPQTAHKVCVFNFFFLHKLFKT